MFKVSSIVTSIGHFFVGIFAKALPSLEASVKAELVNVEVSITGFAATDLGKLAIDAVSAASTLPAGTNSAMFAAAKAQFIADAKTAGHDLETIGLGVVDWMIQTAYTFTANVVASAQSAVPTK